MEMLKCCKYNKRWNTTGRRLEEFEGEILIVTYVSPVEVAIWNEQPSNKK